MSSSYRTTRTFQSSSIGPGGARVTEKTTIIGGPDGTRTETTTYKYSGSSQPDVTRYSSNNSSDNSNNMGLGDRFNNMNIRIGSGGISVESGGGNRRRQPERNSRYSKGWGSTKPSRGSSGPPQALSSSGFTDIKKELLSKGQLFEDPDFPAVDTSLFYSQRPARSFVWKRPKEICSNPQLFVGGASRFDVQQGELGDCWLLAAVASITQYKNLLYRVVPPDQSFTDSYAGIFKFSFWRFGVWTDVIIDDRLPTYNNRLVFMHSAENTEFWTALLEKAYAKLHGSYEALKGGSTSEAMEDFTGGVTEIFDMRQPDKLPPKFFKLMSKAYDRSSLMGCSIEADPTQIEAKGPLGLILGHAYSITGVREVEVSTSRTQGKIPLVRVRNPWGNEAEWEGAWSDKSREWSLISEQERKKIGLTFDDDGEFWMSFTDFMKYFEKVEICNLGPDSVTDDDKDKKRFAVNQIDGSWRNPTCAGGCRNFLDSFWTNPQYKVDVIDADDDDDDDTGTLIVALMQKERRKLREKGLDLLTMGYSIYKLKEDSGPLDLNFFKYNASVARSPSFINLREICGRHKLPPGKYCILPSTFEPKEEGEFLLRIYSEKPADSSEMDEETSLSPFVPEPSPPTEQDNALNNQLRGLFEKIASADGEVDAYELKEILDKAYKQFKCEFSEDTCRSLVAMMDYDHSGKLDFDEFLKLWGNIRNWKDAFTKYDTDRSGTFNSFELRGALSKIGLRLNNRTFDAIVKRYTRKNGTMHFDDFIHCVARLRTMFDTFAEMDPSNSGKAVFGLDQFIQTTMYS